MTYMMQDKFKGGGLSQSRQPQESAMLAPVAQGSRGKGGSLSILPGEARGGSQPMPWSDDNVNDQIVAAAESMDAAANVNAASTSDSTEEWDESYE